MALIHAEAAAQAPLPPDDDTGSMRRRPAGLDPLARALIDSQARQHEALMGALRLQHTAMDRLTSAIVEIKERVPTHQDASRAQRALLAVVFVLIMLLAESRGLSGADAIRGALEFVAPGSP